MVPQMHAVDFRVFRGNRCNARLKARVMIAERPCLARLTGGLLNLVKTLLRCLDFIYEGGTPFPADRRVPADCRGINRVTIHNDGGWLVLLAEGDKGPMRGRRRTRPVVCVR